MFKATKMAQMFEETLLNDWNQFVKASSKQVLATFGNRDLVACDCSWSVADTTTVLGHIIQSTGGCDQDFAATTRALWRSFFANAGKFGNRRLSLQCKLKLLSRATVPHLDGHSARWPFAQSRANQLNKLQRKMLAVCIPVVSYAEESAESYCWRRNKVISDVQSRMGKWSVRWARKQLSWCEHLCRDRNDWSWGAKLLSVRTPDELAIRRAQLGRPQTRTVPSWCASRWRECIDNAKTHV